MEWTPASIAEKYKACASGVRDGKPLHGFIMCVDGREIGYIQYYSAYDFPGDVPLVGLPESLAAMDLYIGEAAYIGKGLGPQFIEAFLK